MDLVNQVLACVSSWSDGGAQKCHATLLQAHSNPFEPKAVDCLTTAYQTLLSATLKTWSQDHTLIPEQLLSFVQELLKEIPTSSSGSSSASTAFGEHFVDVIWSLDATLDEIISEANAASPSKDTSQSEQTPDASTALSPKERAESDKKTVSVILKQFLDARIVCPNFCRERLDTTLLAAVGLIHEKALFDRKVILKRTALFYKSTKFNLLREQSEGYSKILVELTSALGPSHSADTGRPLESPTAILERARPVWEKLISIVGYFDLDPNRALDIILDVFSVNVATHYSFFLALLSLTPWASKYPVGESRSSKMAEDSDWRGKTLDEILQTLDSAPGAVAAGDDEPKVLAQILGFKFAYYELPEVEETVPRNLYITAALLIREGNVGLEDVYSHLSPDDKDMENVHQEYLSSAKSRSKGNRMNQLAMAAPLESSSYGSSRQKTSTTVDTPKPVEKKKDFSNQKVGLLSGLLTVGALRQGLAILSRFPWLVDVRPEIADLLIRVMTHSIQPMYQSQVMKEKDMGLSGFRVPRGRYGSNGELASPVRKQALTTWAPAPPCTASTDFVFFFPDWVERVPICQSLDDLQAVIEPMLHFVGVHMSRSTTFIHTYVRLARQHLGMQATIDPETKNTVSEGDAEHPIRQYWFRILRVYLLPALALVRGNAVCTVEMWGIIRQYDIASRWKLYAEWLASYHSHPELQVRHAEATREAKDILRRLSHKTIDTLAGPVAKLVHTNPCIFFPRAVSQVMAYDNMGSVVVQALRYCATMDFDVLVFSVLDALSKPDRERVKDDGVNTSDWLQSISSFIGMLFRRYSTDITPMLNYIVHQLYTGQTTEIVVLKELIWKMAGIEPLPNLNDSQIAAMAGGPTLRIEAVASSSRGARLDPADASLKAPQRLGNALMSSRLALPLLIQVAQQRQTCVFKVDSAPLKPLAGLYDATHGVLLQYLELLTTSSAIKLEDYAKTILPPVGDLGEMYGICPPICMQFIRPVLQASLMNQASAMEKDSVEEEKRLKAQLKAKQKPPAPSRVDSPAVGSKEPPTEPKQDALQRAANSAAEDVAMDSDPKPMTTSPLPARESPWQPELEALFDDIKRILPSAAYDTLGPGFYATFWQLSTYDLSPPVRRYEDEVAQLKALSSQEDSKYNMADRAGRRQTATAHRLSRDRYNACADQLINEMKDQAVYRSFTIKRLAKEKTHWFAHLKGEHAETRLIESIIEHCIQPRALLSPMDADFCAQMIRVIHTQGTPGFHTLKCYDKILDSKFSVVLFSCSEYEAKNYGTSVELADLHAFTLQSGRFLLGVLMDLNRWREDEASYIQDNRSKSGPKASQHPGFRLRWAQPDSVVKWTAFKSKMTSWYRKLMKCFLDCIMTGEFMHVYNAIIVLKEILPKFPLKEVDKGGGGILDSTLDNFLEIEERGDLKIIARAYHASLKNVRKREEDESTPTEPRGTNQKPLIPSGPHSTRHKADLPTGPSSQSNAAREASRNTPKSSTVVPVQPAPRPATAENAPVSFSAAQDLRPKVVKRVRQDASANQSPIGSPKPGTPTPIQDEASATRLANSNGQAQGTAPVNGTEEGQMTSLSEPQMPPPSVPSQTTSAHELRETARQSIQRSDRAEDRPSKILNGSEVEEPVARSPSPPSRPGTRNPSSDSRHSAGRSRPDRTKEEEKRHREGDSRHGHESRETAVSRRDSLSHTRSSGKNRDEKGDERDRDRGRRDRHERDHRSERDHKDRERDRHRRGDDKDSRKDREAIARATGIEEGSRRPVQSIDDTRKRRRPTDDDSERGSKRGNGRRDGRAEAERPRRRDNEAEDDRHGLDASRSAPPPNTPTGPRTNAPLLPNPPGRGRSETDRDRRDPSRHVNGGAAESSGQSLSSRISGPAAGAVDSYRPAEDDRTNRKRNFTERERDSSNVGYSDNLSPKRPRLERNRYGGADETIRNSLSQEQKRPNNRRRQ